MRQKKKELQKSFVILPDVTVEFSVSKRRVSYLAETVTYLQWNGMPASQMLHAFEVLAPNSFFSSKK